MSFRLLIIGIAGWLVLGGSQTVHAQSVRVSRDSGVAPLAVWFDATAVTCAGFSGCSDPFNDLEYEWDFGDPGSGTWSLSGKPKNRAFGAVGFHVFEPGTYRATLNVTNGAGQRQTFSVSITASDPGASFKAGQTFCAANRAGTFQGCPLDTNNDGTCDVESRNCVVTSDAANAARSICNVGRSSSRCLFRRGDTFSVGSDIGFGNNGPVIVGAFGTGAKPVFRRSGTGDIFTGTSARDIRILDIDGRCSGDGCSFGNFGPTTSRLTLLRNAIDRADAGILFPCKSDYHNCSEIAYVENRITNHFDRWGAYGSAVFIASMGNDFSTGGFSHIVRHPSWRKAVFSHNRMFGAKFHAMKLHAQLGTGASNRSEFLVVSDNSVGATGSFQLSISSSDADEAQELAHCLVERNRLSRVESKVGIYMACRDGSVRGNLLDLSGEPGVIGIRVAARGFTAPDRVRVFNNTSFCTQCEQNATCISVESSKDSRVQNNLCFQPGGPALTGVNDAGSGTILSNNLTSSDGDLPRSPFLGSNLSVLDPDAFVLDPNGVAAGGGRTLTVPVRDFKMRSFGNPWDVGALSLSEDDGKVTQVPSPPILIEVR